MLSLALQDVLSISSNMTNSDSKSIWQTCNFWSLMRPIVCWQIPPSKRILRLYWMQWKKSRRTEGKHSFIQPPWLVTLSRFSLKSSYLASFWKIVATILTLSKLETARQLIHSSRKLWKTWLKICPWYPKISKKPIWCRYWRLHFSRIRSRSLSLHLLVAIATFWPFSWSKWATRSPCYTHSSASENESPILQSSSHKECAFWLPQMLHREA